MPLAGWLCGRIGSRPVTIGALLAAGSSLVLVSLAGDFAGLTAALVGFGAGFGGINVGANAQGVALERRYGRPILSSFHAAFSGGGLAGAGLGALAAAGGVEPRAHFTLVSLALGLVAIAAGRRLLPRAAGDRGTRTLARPPRKLLVLGAAAFFTLLAEGAAVDWSAVYLSASVAPPPASPRSATPPSRSR